MHIAFFNRAFYPEESATGQLLTELAQGLARGYGCRVSVVAGVPPRSPRSGSFPPGFRLLTEEKLGDISILRAWGTTFSKQSFAGRACNYFTYFGSACLAALRLERPDVVIALTDPPIIGLAALLAARRFRCPLVISFRDLFPEVGRLLEDFRSPWVDRMLTEVNRILIRKSDRLVALGEAMKYRLVREKGAPAEKVVLIPDWADTTAIVPGPKRNPFSLENGLADRFVVMHSGNLGVSQNLAVLLQAAHLLQHLPDFMILLVGEGIQKPALQSQAQELGLANVVFLPHQPKEKLGELFACADCFIVSLKPGLSGYIMPSKLYGILAAGRPYVAAVDELCDVARITKQFQCGLLAKPADPQDLAAKILSLYQNRELGREMGGRARLASEGFDRSRGVKAYYELCRTLVNR